MKSYLLLLTVLLQPAIGLADTSHIDERRTYGTFEGVKVYSIIAGPSADKVDLFGVFEFSGKKITMFRKPGIPLPEARRETKNIAVLPCRARPGSVIFRAQLMLHNIVTDAYVVESAKNRWGRIPMPGTACPSPDAEPVQWNPQIPKAPLP